MDINLEILKNIKEMSLSIGKIDGLVLQQQELKDDFKDVKNDVNAIQQSQAVMCNNIKHIVDDNLEFKNSMDKNITTLKTDYYKTRDKVNVLQWAIGLITLGITSVLTIFGAKIKF